MASPAVNSKGRHEETQDYTFEKTCICCTLRDPARTAVQKRAESPADPNIEQDHQH